MEREKLVASNILIIMALLAALLSGPACKVSAPGGEAILATATATMQVAMESTIPPAISPTLTPEIQATSISPSAPDERLPAEIPNSLISEPIIGGGEIQGIPENISHMLDVGGSNQRLVFYYLSSDQEEIRSMEFDAPIKEGSMIIRLEIPITDDQGNLYFVCIYFLIETKITHNADGTSTINVIITHKSSFQHNQKNIFPEGEVPSQVDDLIYREFAPADNA